MARPKRGVYFNCDVCGKESYLSLNQYNEQKQHCCSLKCRNELRGKNYLPGKRFGKLTVLERGKYSYEKNGRMILCKCDCGNTTTVTSANRGKIHSCGCLGGKPTHGMTGTPEMHSWTGMNRRCNNEKDKAYKHYGGRGIKVLYKNFEEFLDDVGPKPGPEYSIDRIDVNGNYEKGNCRRATNEQQSNNTRFNTKCIINGEEHNLKERAKKLGITYNTLKYRINKGIIKGEIYPSKLRKNVTQN